MSNKLKMKLFFVASTLFISAPSFASDVCESIPQGADVAYLNARTIVPGTDYAQIGDTKGYLKGREDNYFVHQHNGLPKFEGNCSTPNPVVVKDGLRGILVTTPAYFKKHYGNKFTGNGGLEIKDLPMLSDDQKVTAGLNQYVGKKLDKEVLKDFIRDVVVDMRDKNQPVVDVFAPKQDVTTGNLVILVDRAVIGDVIVRGNQYYDSDTIRRYLSSAKGEYIYSDDLARDLRWMNTNPYRNVDVVFKPGQKPGTTDVVLETKDMYPARVFAGVDNYGSESTNQNEFNIGFSYGNLFGLDHEVIYNFISSFDFANFNAHTLQYNIPFEWRHKLSLTGTYSESSPKAIDPLFDQEGKNITLNAEYEVPLYTYGLRGFTHDYKIGLDYKRIQSSTDFGGNTIFDEPAVVAQGYVTYDLSRTTNNSLNLGSVSVVISPGDLLDDNNKAAFTQFSQGAESRYYYLKGLYDGNYTEENYGIGFRALLRGQFANEKLLSSEQMALDGPGAVRGFGSNNIRTDKGFVATLEISSPYVPVLDEYLGTKLRDRVQGFVFYDRGTGINEKPLGVGVTDDSTTLQSIGLGTRFGIGRNMNGVIEYGYEVGADTENNGRDQHLQFRLNTSY